MMEVHQILPTITPGDAVSNDAVEIQKVLLGWGYSSEIYAENIRMEKSQKKIKSYTDYKKKSSQNNILLLHFSIGSPVWDFVRDIPDKKILIYHNITPHNFFVGINNHLADLAWQGRYQLRNLCDSVELALGDSEYNRRELVEFGFKNTGVLPLFTIDYRKYTGIDSNIQKRYDDGYTNILFVGKIAPHKKLEDLIKIFFYYKKFINQDSRLLFIGGCDGMEKYSQQLQDLIKKLELKDVHFTGHIRKPDQIASYYKLADIFVCMSEHEGFCVPLLECMQLGIPIIAYNSTAIPYTLGTTGILVNEKRYDEIAELIHIIVENKKIRNRIVEKQRERSKEFDRKKTETALKNYIESL